MTPNFHITLTTLLLVAAFNATASEAPNSSRAAEITQCLPGEIQTWNDGRDRAAQTPLVFAYEPAGAPPWFTRREVYALIEAALAGWGGCDLKPQLLSLGQMASTGVIRVRWNEAGARGNFGLANLSDRTLSLSPAMFKLLRERNPNYPAQETLQMTLSHEIGHFFGLMAHSRRCVDVMSYYTRPPDLPQNGRPPEGARGSSGRPSASSNGKGEQCALRDPAEFKRVPEYRSSVPTACDIARCRAVNGALR